MSVNSYIDHTLLKADANKEQILSLIDEAKKYEFASVCVNPTWVKTAAELLKDSSVKVCTVIGFKSLNCGGRCSQRETNNLQENLLNKE